jgi:hypothetical protein
MKKVLTTVALLIGMVGMTQTIPSDKVTHFAAGGFITSTTYIGLNLFELKESNRVLISIGTGIVAGIAKEAYDKGRGGKFDGKDILATALGSVSITIPIIIGRKKHYTVK